MKGQQLGFIAQEVEKVLPQIVLTAKDKDKTKGLKYDEFIPVLTLAVQQLKAADDKAIAALTAKIEIQATEIETLRNELGTLEARHTATALESEQHVFKKY